MPSEATSAKTADSDVYFLPVRSDARLRKARSVGRNAVRATFPSARTPTAEPGLALSTAVTALSTMSKSFQLRSKPEPSLASTAARLRVPVAESAQPCAEADGALTRAAVPARPRAATAVMKRRANMLVLQVFHCGVVVPDRGHRWSRIRTLRGEFGAPLGMDWTNLVQNGVAGNASGRVGVGR